MLNSAFVHCLWVFFNILCLYHFYSLWIKIICACTEVQCFVSICSSMNLIPLFSWQKVQSEDFSLLSSCSFSVPGLHIAIFFYGRQPKLLCSPCALVSLSLIKGFLYERFGLFFAWCWNMSIVSCSAFLLKIIVHLFFCPVSSVYQSHSHFRTGPWLS